MNGSPAILVVDDEQGIRESLKRMLEREGYRVHLAEDGRVAKVEPLSNTIRVDPKLVMRCVVRELARWRFTPPRGVAPRFTMDFVFSDKC